MKFIEGLLTSLLPTLSIRPRWRLLWQQRDLKAYLKTSRVYFVVFAAVYVAHYYFVDIPLNKQPLELWAKYRFGLAASSILGLVISFNKPLQASRYFRLPLIVSGLLFSYMQAQSMIWRNEVPYLYSILIPTISAIALRTSVLPSCLFLFVSYGLEFAAWQNRPRELSYILSAATVGLIVTAIFRSRMSADVEAFISQQEQLEIKQELIED